MNNTKRAYRVHICHPFALDKNYGKELNDTFEIIPSQDFLCICDWDAMFLSHTQIPMLYDYIDKYPDTGMFLAMSNRSGSHGQRWNGQISPQMQMNQWHRTAMNIKPTLDVVEVRDNKISGFLMMISKKVWNDVKFDESLQVLGVDRSYAQRLLVMGYSIKIMKDILVYHSYRAWNGNKNADHLI